MFGKRRRAASNPAQRAPPSASASLAATKAFVRDRESNPNLSNAAAAAALRTHATSPTQVGDTVTKRMVRRGSMSSNGSTQRPGLQRQNSSGSMTERSFRNSSPANAPPVPALPQDPAQSHRRASSLEPVYRGGSPAPRGGGRGVSLDRGSGSVAAGRGQRATSNLAQVVEVEQDSGRPMSVNFSRPMSPASAARQNNSPQANKGWFGGPVVNQEAVQRMASTSRPKTSSGVPTTDLHNTQQSVQNAASRPVQTHQIARGVEGSRLSSGSMRAKPSGTAVESKSFLQLKPQPPRGPVDPKSPDAIFDPSTRTFIHKQDAMARHRELHQEPESPVHDYVVQHLEDQPPQQISQPAPLPRTPSPARQDLRQPQPTVQKKTSADLPKLDIGAAVRRPEDPPTGFPGHDQKEPVLQRQHSEDLAGADIRPAEPRTVSPAPKTVTQPEHADLESPRFAPNQDSSYPRLPNPVIPTTTNTVASAGRGSVRIQNGRGQSLSPQRNAHFAPVAVELAGVKHQPPPRSISPAKSALKSSPSVSRRGSSPVASNGRLSSRGASSEASDTTSEGGTMRRKKEVRVSFEATPVIAGTSAYAEAETPSTPAGLSASEWSPTREKDNEFEDFMKPRPALPSFGSIRDKERRAAHEDPPEKVTETVSSTPMSASIASVGEPLHTSSDHAIAGIVTQDFAQKQAKSNDPLPPEVTSVEGSGYISDSSDDLDSSSGIRKHGVLDDSSQILPDPEPKSLSASHEEKPSTPASVQEQVIEVPDIALLPATPSPYEKPQPTFPTVAAPGGWTEDSTETRVEPAVVSPITSKQESTSPATQPAAAPTTLQELITRDEEDSSDDDNSSIYSDAYEDLSDAEGGFASIDAVVESPVVPSPGGLMFSKHADKSTVEGSGSGLRNETTPDDAVKPAKQSTQDWDATQQHWSGLNESRKQRTDMSTSADGPATLVVHKQETSRPTRELSSTESTPQKQTPSPRGKTQADATQQASRPLKSALKKTMVAPSVPAPEPQMRKTMRGPAPPRQNRAPEPQMRTTMRGPSLRENRGPEPQMRKTMRGGVDAPRAQPQIRTSMRGQDAVASNPTGLAASRHSMLPVEQKPPRGALQKRHIPASAMAPRPQSMPVAPSKQKAPVPAYDSDSDASVSSFRRTRSRPNAGQRTMRTSMRSGPAPTMRSAAPAAAPIRSISPPGSPTPALRKSMRPSSPTPDVPKSSRFSIRSLSPMGRFRNAKPIEAAPPSPTQPKKFLGSNKASKQKAPAQAPARAKPAFKSRFANSSDEEDDDDRPARFQSRFADSDSEEELNDYQLPPGLAPVRGIPRKAGEEDGDSTDLEEEAEERPRLPAPTKEVGFKEVTNGDSKPHTNGNQGTALATGSLRDSKHAPPLPSFDKGNKPKTKRSFFGLGKKKSASKPDPTNSIPSTAPSDIPLPPSTIRRDTGPLTPIDEDKDLIPPPSPETKRSPKLQRRSTPEWPLPRNNIPVPPIPDDDRPMSSDGGGRRPRITKRQWSGTSNITTATAPVGTEGRAEVVGRSGKKKKFQGLRRVFGLND